MTSRYAAAVPSPPPDAPTVPLYRRVADDLCVAIRAGCFPPGTRLSTEHELCRHYGVSRITVRKALEALLAERLVLRRRGVGTIVRSVEPDRWSVTVTAPFDEGVPPQRFVLLRQATVAAPADVLAGTGWPAGERLRLFEATNHVANGGPLAHVQFFFPLALGCELTGAMVAAPVPTHRVLAQRFGLRVHHARQVVEAAAASAKSARLLQVPTGTPVLRALHSYHDGDGRALYATDSVYHPQRFRLAARFEARPA